MLGHCRLKVVGNQVLTQVSLYFKREEARVFVFESEVIDADRPVRITVEDSHEVGLYFIE
jgi:hypothetical protein